MANSISWNNKTVSYARINSYDSTRVLDTGACRKRSFYGKQHEAEVESVKVYY